MLSYFAPALIALSSYTTVSPACDIASGTANWVVRAPGRTPSRTGTFVATDYMNVKGVDFNINWDIRHGQTGGNGTYVGSNGLSVEYGSGGKTFIMTGTFSPNCTAITWLTSKLSPPVGGTVWCAAWTVGCVSPSPPYGLTMSFLKTQGDNMVLQRAPAKAAVYGIYGPDNAPKNAKITVTVIPMPGTSGTKYTVDAEINTVHQAREDPNYPGAVDSDGPYSTWKAFLNPTAAGGDYTITVNCTSNCGGCVACFFLFHYMTEYSTNLMIFMIIILRCFLFHTLETRSTGELRSRTLRSATCGTAAVSPTCGFPLGTAFTATTR